LFLNERIHGHLRHQHSLFFSARKLEISSILLTVNMNAVVDTIVHMDTFRNIDLFFQGVYYFQLTLSH